MSGKKIETISEEYFNEKTKHLNYIEKYVSPYEALVIKGDDSLFYINQRGNCFIMPDLQTVDSFLRESISTPKPHSYYSFIKSLGSVNVDSIHTVIDQFAQTNSVSFKGIDLDAIRNVDEIVAKTTSKENMSVVIYCIVGEYIRYAFSNGYSWINIYDPELKVNLPVLIEVATGKQIRFEDEIFNSLNDQRVETPVSFAVQAIFYKL